MTLPSGTDRLLGAIRKLAGARTLEDVTSIVRHEARVLAGADGVTFVLRDGENVFYADEEAVAPLWKGQQFPIGSCVSGWAMMHRQAAVIADVYSDPRVPIAAYRGTFVRSLAMIPVGHEEPVAAIGAYWSERHVATEHELAMLHAIADATALALTNEILVRRHLAAEHAALLSRSQMLLLFDEMPQLGWTARADGYIDHYNRRWFEYTGTTFEEMQGWGWEKVHDPELLPLVNERWRASLASGTPFEMEFRLRRHDGVFRWFITRIKPLHDAAGNVVRWVGINTDIEDRKRADEEKARLLEAAAESSRIKDEFLAMLGHELRNPLSPITAALHVIRTRNADGLHREIGIIERQVRHLTRLVDDLLDLSRVTSGKVVLHRRPVEIAPIAVDAGEITAPLLAGKEQSLSLDIEPGLVIDADPERMAQALANLVGNASRFSGPGARIAVRGRREDGEVVVSVHDEGRGIEPELLPRMFEPFVQGARSLARREGGLGVGLAIVRKLVDLHGGTIEAASAGVGRGSTFTMRLPAAAADSEDVARAGISPDGGGMRVLVVDDNQDAADTLAELLRIYGHEVAIAYDGHGALAVAEAFRPQLAVLDVGLPEMDGYELARRLRAHPHLAGTRLIALTGYGLQEDRARALAAGYDHHLVKPVDIDALLALCNGSPDGA